MSEYRPRPTDHLVEPVFAALDPRGRCSEPQGGPAAAGVPTRRRGWLWLALAGAAGIWLLLP